jgi:hypothetical protein
VDWPTSPGKGIETLLKRTGLKVEDIDMWEINEAFAVVPIPQNFSSTLRTGQNKQQCLAITTIFYQV